MTAVAEKSVALANTTPDTPDPIDTFVMPRPAIGQLVLWYPNADPNAAPEVAAVRRRGHRNIVVGLGGGLPRESVRHVDDPKLKLSPSQRENGAWDFTDRDKQYASMHSELTDVKSRLKTLEDLILESPKKAGK